MIELTGFASVLRGISVMYWLLAVGAVGLAIWKGKTIRTKALWVGVSIAVFGILPAKAMIERAQRDAYVKDAWAYFKRKCDTESGEKIYKTFTGVESVLVVKPLPPATEKDLFDQFWYGDPYSDSTPWEKRAEHAAGKLVYPNAPIAMQKQGKGLRFVESYVPGGAGRETKRIKVYYEPSVRDYRTESITTFISRFGLQWEDISTPDDRKYWIAGSRLSVIDLSNNTLVAERIGYFIEAGFGSKAGQRRPWLTSKGPTTTCPYSHDWTDRWFILKVFDASSEKHDGK